MIAVVGATTSTSTNNYWFTPTDSHKRVSELAIRFRQVIIDHVFLDVVLQHWRRFPSTSATTQPQDQVQRGVINRPCRVLALLATENEALLIGRNASFR